MFGGIITTSIAASGSATAAIPLNDRLPASLMLPTGSASFTASTATVVFQVANDGTNYDLLRDNSGAIVSLTVGEDNTLGRTHLDPDKFRGWTHMKVEARNASAAAVVAQAAARAIKIGTERK